MAIRPKTPQPSPCEYKVRLVNPCIWIILLTAASLWLAKETYAMAVTSTRATEALKNHTIVIEGLQEEVKRMSSIVARLELTLGVVLSESYTPAQLPKPDPINPKPPIILPEPPTRVASTP